MRKKLVRVAFLGESERSVPERAEALGYILDETDEFVGLFIERLVPSVPHSEEDHFFLLKRESILRIEEPSETI